MEAIIKFTFIVLMALFFAVLSAYPVMVLWNWLMPKIFGLTEITFWQAFGLLILTNVLFKPSGGSKSE